MADAPQLTREQKASRFRAIVDRRARMSLDWQLTPEGGGIVGRLIAGQPLDPVLTFDVNADRNDIDAIAAMPDDYDFLIEAVRDLGRQLNDREIPPPDQPYSPAQNCGKWCSKRIFQRFMFEVKGLDHPEDAQRMRTKIHSLLNIKSRADLDTNPAAAEGWHKLVPNSRHGGKPNYDRLCRQPPP